MESWLCTALANTPPLTYIPGMEPLFAFREALLQVHRPGLLNTAQLKDFAGTLVTEEWCILRSKRAGVVLRRAAEDLREYFEVSMRLDLPVVSDARRFRHAIRLSVDSRLPPRTCRIRAGKHIVIAGTDERAAAQGCYLLEDEMNLNGVPGLAAGTLRRTARFSPRMIHSGLGFDLYPDEHLRAIAHAGMDAIVLNLYGAMDNPNVSCAANDTIRRAASFGLDVYCFSCFKNLWHPADPEARARYAELQGRMFEYFPGLKGIIFVGEACEFPSRDPRTTGRNWHESLDDARPSPGWFPCSDYPEFMALMRDVVRARRPDADVILWSYNWGYLDAGLRIELIEHLPADIVLMATFEMFEEVEVAPGVVENCCDYTLWRTGPSAYFASEAAAAKRRGLRMYAMTNTGGNTWDIGTVPYLPTPQAWIRRFQAINHAQQTWRLDGLMESHTYGFWPSLIPELAKAAFMSPMPVLDELLARLVARDFGTAHAGEVLRAMERFSEGIGHCVPTNQEQYGPCRIGPAYPLFFERSEPLPIGPRSARNPNSTCNPVYRYSPDQADKLRWETGEYTRMMESFHDGCEILERVVAAARGRAREAAMRLLGLARYIENTARTTVHAKRWHALKWRLGICVDADPIWVGGRKGMEDACPLTAPEPAPAEEQQAALRELIEIAEAEIRNAEATIPLVEADSRLGYTQELDYCASSAQLRWKIAVTSRAVNEEILPRMRGVTPESGSAVNR
ncbi:MAG: hypothetical protein PHR35_07370 [Kiritimatiellae bacterium]|nr:hypothetical protein [Kiritimatiellia bacterium]